MSPSAWAGQVLALEPTFRRAPSAHNTQPATISLDRQGGRDGDALVVGWDPACELTVSDPTRRDLWLSLGAYLEAVVIAAADAGLGVRVATHADTRRRRFAHVHAAQPARHPQGFTVADLCARRTARGPYAEPYPTAAEIEQVASAAGLRGPEGPRLEVVPREVVDRLLPAADRWAYSSRAQVDELRQWLRLSTRDPRYRADGLTYEALAMTTSQARALSLALRPRTWGLLRRLGGPRLVAASSSVRGRGTVVALTVPAEDADTPEAVGRQGGVLLRVWLAAGRTGLRVHPLSQMVDAPATANALEDLVNRGAGTPRRALSVFRVGAPVTEPVRSARRGE